MWLLLKVGHQLMNGVPVEGPGTFQAGSNINRRFAFGIIPLSDTGSKQNHFAPLNGRFGKPLIHTPTNNNKLTNRISILI